MTSIEDIPNKYEPNGLGHHSRVSCMSHPDFLVYAEESGSSVDFSQIEDPTIKLPPTQRDKFYSKFGEDWKAKYGFNSRR